MSVRLEYSKSKRAGCKATECKTQGIKIDKGELRHCTFVSFGDNQSWVYRHWGCVTPRQIANLNTAIEGNLDYLDGYDELTEEDKKKVRQALADGHVADEDWRYDVEMNRPGKNGFRSPANKAAMKAETSDEQHRSESPSKPEPKKKRGRTKKVEDSEAEAGEPKPKKAKSRKVKIEDASEAEAEVPQSKKSRAAPKRVKKEENGVVDAPEETQSKKPKASVKRVKKEQDNEADNAVNAKPKRSRQAPVKLKKEIADDAEGSDTITPPKTRAPRKKAVAVVERPPGNEEDGHAAGSASEAKAEQSDESDSAFGSEDKLTTTNGRIKQKSGINATNALPKQVKADAPHSTKRVTRSLKA